MRARLLKFFLDYPLFTRLVGLLVAIGGGWLVYQQGIELQRMRAEPSIVDISILPEAVQFNHAYYVTLRGGRFDCASLVIDQPSLDNPCLPQTSALYQGPDSFAVFAHFLGIRTCEDLQSHSMTGTIRKIEEPEIFDVRELYPPVDRLPREETIYDLCTTCGPIFPFLGLLGGAFLVALGLLLVPICRGLLPDYQPGTAGIYGLGPRWERRKR